MTKEQALAALKRYRLTQYPEDEYPAPEEDECGEFVWADDADKILSGAVLQRYEGWGEKGNDGDLYLYDDVVESLRMRNG
jgi:hypothetical protein